MSPGDVDQILRELHDLRTETTKRFDDQDRQKQALRSDLQEVKRDVTDLKTRAGKIEKQTTDTNGRVTTLETSAKIAKALAEAEAENEGKREHDREDARSNWLSRRTSIQATLLAAALGIPGLVVSYLILEVLKTGHV